MFGQVLAENCPVFYLFRGVVLSSTVAALGLVVPPVRRKVTMNYGTRIWHLEHTVFDHSLWLRGGGSRLGTLRAGMLRRLS